MIIKPISLMHLILTSIYLDDLLNDNPYFERMVIQNPHELQLNKANTSDTDVPFLDLPLSTSNGFVPPFFMINLIL